MVKLPPFYENSPPYRSLILPVVLHHKDQKQARGHYLSVVV